MREYLYYFWLVDSVELSLQNQMTRITLNPSIRLMSPSVQDISLRIKYNGMNISIVLDDRISLWCLTFNKNLYEYVRFWVVIPELHVFSKVADILLDYQGELIYLKDSNFFRDLIPILPYYKLRVEDKVYRLSRIVINKVLDEGFLPSEVLDLIIDEMGVGNVAILSREFNSIGVEEDAIATYLLIRELVPIQLLRTIILDDSLRFKAYISDKLTVKMTLLEEILEGNALNISELTDQNTSNINRDPNEILEKDFPFIRKYLRRFKGNQKQSSSL